MADIKTDNVTIYEDPKILQFTDDKENVVEFWEIASIAYEGKFYGLFEPVDRLEGFGEGDGVLMEYDEENKEFLPFDDLALAESVFAEYEKAASEYGDACGCCDCGDCDDDCNCEDEGCSCGCQHHHDA